MASGKATGTSSSAELLAASEARKQVTIMHQGTASVAIGIDADAVADEGVILGVVGDSVTIRGLEAQAAINIIGNTGKITYQTGEVEFRGNGGTPT